MSDNGHAPRPYTRGWLASWRGQWGPLRDGHSRLARLRDRIKRELRTAYVVSTPLEERWLHLAAVNLALAVKTEADMDTDPRATPRTLRNLQKTADAQLAKLRPQVAPGLEALLRQGAERG